MTLGTFWLGRASVSFGALTLLAVLALVLSRENAFRRRLREHHSRLERDLGFLQSNISARAVLYGQALGLLVAMGLGAAHAPFLAAIVTLVVLCPPFVVARCRLRRVLLIEDQVESWLTALANALHANPSLGEAVASTTGLLKDPLASELELVMKEHQLGCSLEMALAQAAERIGGTTFKTAVVVLKTARRTGGSLPETLATTAANLREMARLEGVVRTKTAEGKTQAFIISVVPLPLYLGIRLMNPEFFTPLETTFTGHVIFGVAAMLWLGAFLLARRFLSVDV